MAPNMSFLFSPCMDRQKTPFLTVSLLLGEVFFAAKKIVILSLPSKGLPFSLHHSALHVVCHNSVVFDSKTRNFREQKPGFLYLEMTNQKPLYCQLYHILAGEASN
jgi:hypothetical protein